MLKDMLQLEIAGQTERTIFETEIDALHVFSQSLFFHFPAETSRWRSVIVCFYILLIFD